MHARIEHILNTCNLLNEITIIYNNNNNILSKTNTKFLGIII